MMLTQQSIFLEQPQLLELVDSPLTSIELMSQLKGKVYNPAVAAATLIHLSARGPILRMRYVAHVGYAVVPDDNPSATATELTLILQHVAAPHKGYTIYNG